MLVSIYFDPSEAREKQAMLDAVSYTHLVLRFHSQQMPLHPCQAHLGAVVQHQGFSRFLFQESGQNFRHAGEQGQHLIRHFPAHGQSGLDGGGGNNLFRCV